jgi:hypothetical protein
MTREQFEHAIRAAGAVLDVSDVLVIGSQAVHGSMEEPLPIEAARSVEVLELHDLWIAKAIAGREKDLKCCTALVRRNAVYPDALRVQLASVAALDDAVRAAVAARIPS